MKTKTIKMTDYFVVRRECGHYIGAEVEVALDVDNNYGADADGNRGIRTISVEILNNNSILEYSEGESPTVTEEFSIRRKLRRAALEHKWDTED